MGRENLGMIETWESECMDCGFISGMAEVRFPNGNKILLSGAGCRSRRGPREAMAWAVAQIELATSWPR